MDCTLPEDAGTWDSLTRTLFCDASVWSLLILLTIFLIALGTIAGALKELSASANTHRVFSLADALSKILAAVLAVVVFLVPVLKAFGSEALLAACFLVLAIVVVAFGVMFFLFRWRYGPTPQSTAVAVAPATATLVKLVEEASQLYDEMVILAHTPVSSFNENQAVYTNHEQVQGEVRRRSEELRDNLEAYKAKYEQLTGVAF